MNFKSVIGAGGFCEQNSSVGSNMIISTFAGGISSNSWNKIVILSQNPHDFGLLGWSTERDCRND